MSNDMTHTLIPDDFDRHQHLKASHSSVFQVTPNLIKLDQAQFTDREIWEFYPTTYALSKTMYIGATMHAYKSRFPGDSWLFIMHDRPANYVEVIATVRGVYGESLVSEMCRLLYLKLEDVAARHEDPNEWMAKQLYYHHPQRFFERYGTKYLYKVVK